MMTFTCLKRISTVSKCILRARAFSRTYHVTSVKAVSKKSSDSRDEAIPFSSSKAASWSSLNSFGPPPKDMPVYQPIIVCFSLGIFLLYFLFLREENDLDVELNQTLFERVPGLEENHIRAAIKYQKDSGNDTTELEKRLAVLLEEKNRSKK